MRYTLLASTFFAPQVLRVLRAAFPDVEFGSGIEGRRDIVAVTSAEVPAVRRWDWVATARETERVCQVVCYNVAHGLCPNEPRD